MAIFPDPTTLRRAIKKIPGVQRVIGLGVVIEDWWFDLYHNVDTSTQIEEQKTQGWPEDKVNFHYLPIRPKCARRVLRHLPLKDRGEYTFIDFGSGKGRMLLIAAKFGFRRACGIELREELHDQAELNFRQCRHVGDCAFESLHVDAANYEFHGEKLVVFFFNPFGTEVMAKVLANLAASLGSRARDVWVVLHDPSCAYLADNMPQLGLQVARDGYRIYRATPQAHRSEASVSRPSFAVAHR